MTNQTAFGGMLQYLVEFTSIVLRPEPLDAEIKRHCKQAWEQAPCPECGETTIQSEDDSPRDCARVPRPRHRVPRSRWPLPQSHYSLSHRV